MIILLVIIYIAFISLGLPDGILGAAWPVMHTNIGATIASAGAVSMIISAGTVFSSLLSNKVTSRFGTGKVTVFSVFLTAFGLIGISFSNTLYLICMFSVPLGMGAGAVDAALNNFVALHYEAKHMNWLHCFWGIGAAAGPEIMAFSLYQSLGWKVGYRLIGIFQIVLVFALLATLSLWKQYDKKEKVIDGEDLKEQSFSILTVLHRNGAKASLISFFCYCSVEATIGLWGASYFVHSGKIPQEKAAGYIGLFYMAITAGRMLAGFVSIRVSNKKMIQMGQMVCVAGILMLFVSSSTGFLLIGVVIAGLGCAPIYPGMLHETPVRFGTEYSQSMMGIQMAAAYVGTTLMPPLFGILSKTATFSLFPVYILIIAVMMFLSTQKIL